MTLYKITVTREIVTFSQEIGWLKYFQHYVTEPGTFL